MFYLKYYISYHKIATQSHIYLGLYYDTSNAGDENTVTCMRTDAIRGLSPYKTVWWKVDLAGVHSIYSINIQFKNYYGYGMYYKFKYFDNTFVILIILLSVIICIFIFWYTATTPNITIIFINGIIWYLVLMLVHCLNSISLHMFSYKVHIGCRSLTIALLQTI